MIPRTREKPQQKRRPKRVFIRKNCRYCENNVHFVDFKDAELLRKYQTEKGKILPRRITGNCARHQKVVEKAIKRARILSLVL